MMSRRVYLQSSNVDFVAYDDDEHELEVGYKWGGDYLYRHVPPRIWYGLMNASSPGKFVWETIRNNPDYPYELMNYGPEEEVSEKIAPREDTPWWKVW